ncbi:MAG: sulfite exporter TauE/SafE family protein [Propionibacteriaceae bacterium]
MAITAPLLMTLVLSVLVGVSLGLLGGGGSILTVPILTYVLGMDPTRAITSSLFVVGVTALVGMVRHARAGRITWRTGVVFGLAGMVGAFVGGLIGGFIPGAVLMVLFAIMMIVTSLAMIRGRREQTSDTPAPTRHPARVLLDGFGVGFATSLVGAGGGFLVVPALALLGGLPMALAVGTSLLVIAMQSSAGLVGHLVTVSLDWPVVLAVTAAAVVGSFVGTALIGRIPERALRKSFGVFVLVMGAVVLAEEVPGIIASLTA